MPGNRVGSGIARSRMQGPEEEGGAMEGMGVLLEWTWRGKEEGS
jgi:hypothetical protein